jgi:hypothetical protein
MPKGIAEKRFERFKGDDGNLKMSARCLEGIGSAEGKKWVPNHRVQASCRLHSVYLDATDGYSNLTRGCGQNPRQSATQRE